VALALDAAPPEDAAELDRMLGTPLDATRVEQARRIIDESGAHAQVEMVIKELADRALSALERSPVEAEAGVVLRELASAATQRVV
jgi:geranylgeranyl diphosphate synthase, type I